MHNKTWTWRTHQHFITPTSHLLGVTVYTLIFYIPLWIISPDKFFLWKSTGRQQSKLSRFFTIQVIYMDMIINTCCPYKIENDHLFRSDHFCNCFPGLNVPCSKKKIHVFIHSSMFRWMNVLHVQNILPDFFSFRTSLKWSRFFFLRNRPRRHIVVIYDDSVFLWPPHSANVSFPCANSPMISIWNQNSVTRNDF